MQSIEKRIAALEKARPLNIGPFFIHLVGHDTKDSEIQRITKGTLVWERQTDESEQELKDRAIRETPPPKPGCSASFLCY
jgi:hypothetical protein